MKLDGIGGWLGLSQRGLALDGGCLILLNYYNRFRIQFLFINARFMQMNHFSSSLMIPCIIPLFRYDLLSTVGSTQSCSLFPHTRVEVLLSWSRLREVGFVAAVKDCLWNGVARCRSQVFRLSSLLSFSAAFVIFSIFVRRGSVCQQLSFVYPGWSWTGI